MKRDRFFVLPYSIHEEHIPHLMGRVVIDPFDPLRRFIPDPQPPNGFNPEDIVPNILPNPIPYQSRSDIIRSANSSKLQATLSSYFGTNVENIKSDNVQMESEHIKRYQMINNVLIFRKFMAHEGVQSSD
jgi:hypothetical protein